MPEKEFIPNLEGEVVENPVPTIDTTVQEEIAGKAKEVVLEGLDVYIDVITQYKANLQGLINSGYMTEHTAQTLLLESELSFFKQLVKVKYS